MTSTNCPLCLHHVKQKSSVSERHCVVIQLKILNGGENWGSAQKIGKVSLKVCSEKYLSPWKHSVRLYILLLYHGTQSVNNPWCTGWMGRTLCCHAMLQNLLVLYVDPQKRAGGTGSAGKALAPLAWGTAFGLLAPGKKLESVYASGDENMGPRISPANLSRRMSDHQVDWEE